MRFSQPTRRNHQAGMCMIEIAIVMGITEIDAESLIESSLDKSLETTLEATLEVSH